MNQLIRRRLRSGFLLVAFLTMLGCQTPPQPVPEPSEPSVPEPKAPEAEPEALDIEWTGTSWTLPDNPNLSPGTYPGYRGIHLGENGRLFLINLNGSSGNRWTVTGNRMELQLNEGSADEKWSGRFLIYPDPPSAGEAIRLVPEDNEGKPLKDQAIPLRRSRPRVDLEENHWIPRWLAEGNRVIWPMNREIHLMLLPGLNGSMGIIGYGGENRFHGSINYDSQSFTIGPIAITRRFGPASEFENLYVRHLDEATDYVQIEDDLFLYRETEPIAAFRVRLFD